MNRLIPILILGLGFAIQVDAQNVHPIRLDGQPLMYMKDGKVHGCGLRVIGGQPNPIGPIWKWIDVSVNVYEDGRGLVKIVSYNLNTSEIVGKSATPPKPLVVQSGWLKSPGKPATTPTGNTAVSDDGASLLYRTDLERATNIIMSYFRKEPVSIGVRRQGEKTEDIFAGTIGMTEAEDGQLRQCMAELMEKWPK